MERNYILIGNLTDALRSAIRQELSKGYESAYARGLLNNLEGLEKGKKLYIKY